MAILRYVLTLPAALLARLAAILLAPLAVWLRSTPDKLHLRWPFGWMETIDNPLTGDAMWQANQLHGGDPKSWRARTLWMMRNGGQHAMYYFFGVPSDGLVLRRIGTPFGGDAQTGKFYAEKRGAFFLRWCRKITDKRNIDVMLGWGFDDGGKQGRAKICYTVRMPSRA